MPEQASDNGKDWVDLRRHMDDAAINMAGQYESWPVAGVLHLSITSNLYRPVIICMLSRLRRLRKILLLLLGASAAPAGVLPSSRAIHVMWQGTPRAGPSASSACSCSGPLPARRPARAAGCCHCPTWSSTATSTT